MAVLFFDGFESIGAGNSYPTDAVVLRRWQTSAESFYIASGGRSGGKALRFANSADYFSIPASINGIASEDTTKIWGLALYPYSLSGYSTTHYLFRWTTDGGVYGPGIRVWTGGTLSFQNAADTTLAVLPKGTLRTGLWNDLQIKLKYHATTGTCEIRVDGETVLNLSSINTAGSSGNYHNRMFVFSQSSLSTTSPRFDDAFVLDTTGNINNDFIPASRVVACLPESDVATDWAPSTGNDHYAMVDESLPDDAATYITGNTINDIDQFEVADLTSSANVVRSVKLSVDVTLNEAGERDVRQILSSNTTNYAGATQTLNTTNYVYKVDYWDTDPATSDNWTVNNFNASKPGVEVVD